jgi:hypothetical protein
VEAALQTALGGEALSRSQVLHPSSQLICAPVQAMEVVLVEGGGMHAPDFLMKPSLQMMQPVESQE